MAKEMGLEGLVDCHDDALALGRIVAGVPGVKEIDNQLRSIAGHHALRVSNF